MRRRLTIGLGGAAFLALAVASGPGAAPARAQAPGQHRAAVIIDTGTTVKHVCIRFTASSISGKDALDLANQVDPSVQPVYRDYGSLGSFVCALCGTGNPQSDCTGQQSGKYWAYTRAAAGTSQFTTSSMGVSSTQVHDGDVEGWRWGTGGAPAYASVDQICGTVATDGTFTPTSISYNGGPSQPVANGAAPPRGSRAPAPAQAAPATSGGTAPSTPSTEGATGGAATTSSTAPSDGPTGTALAKTPKHAGGSGGGGSLVGLGAFGAVGAGLGAWYWRLRRGRAVPG